MYIKIKITKLQFKMYSQHHSTMVKVPDAKFFCKLLAKGKFQPQTTHDQASGERKTRGAAGDAEAGDPLETVVLHSLHIHSLPTYLSQYLVHSSVVLTFQSLMPG